MSNVTPNIAEEICCLANSRKISGWCVAGKRIPDKRWCSTVCEESAIEGLPPYSKVHKGNSFSIISGVYKIIFNREQILYNGNHYIYFCYPEKKHYQHPFQWSFFPHQSRENLRTSVNEKSLIIEQWGRKQLVPIRIKYLSQKMVVGRDMELGNTPPFFLLFISGKR